MIKRSRKTDCHSQWLSSTYILHHFKRKENVKEIRKELKEPGEFRIISDTALIFFFFKKIIYDFDYALHAFVVTTARNHSQQLRRSCLQSDPMDRKSKNCTYSLQRKHVNTGDSNSFFSFPEKHLLGCYHKLTKDHWSKNKYHDCAQISWIAILV